MFETKETLIAEMRNPLNISALALDEIQNRLGGERIIADPNTPFCHLLEFGASINAASITAIDEKYPVLYPQRATSMDDLFHHMSDFDYLKMYSTPASVNVRVAFSKKYLIDNALNYNTNYKKVTIPRDTVFMVGRYPFGLYYPIDILINNYTNTFTVLYDTTVDNPLHVLTKNVVDKYDTVYKSLEYLLIDFPIYQFARSEIEESTVAETGYVKRIVYNNRFYAVRLYYYKNGQYHEMHQTQSKIVYDASEPTAFIRLLPDEQALKIMIPQVYFDKDLMGSKLAIEMFTTMGAMDVDVSNISGTAIQANFALRSRNTTEYSALLKNLPFDTIIALSSQKIVGGSNAITVDHLRNRVVNDTLYEKVPITENDMKVYLEDNSFYLKKHLDNVTDRIYHAYRVLEDGQGGIIPSLTLKMRMLASYVNDRSSFIQQSDGSITVLPTTLYKYVEEADDAIPLTTDELTQIAQMDKIALANAMNNNHYMRSPFHIRFNLNDNWPQAITYNLLTPEVKKVIFEGENYNVTPRMMTFAGLVSHENSGVGGYKVSLSVYKSDDLEGVSNDDLVIYICTKTTSDYWIGLEATYGGEMVDNGRTLYTFNIETNYHLTDDGDIYVTNFQNSAFALAEHCVPLENDWHVVFLIRKTAIVGSYEDATQKVTHGVPSHLLDTHVALIRQYLTLHLGHSLNDVIKNDVEVSVSGRKYALWDHDVVKTYKEDVYARDSEGMLMTTTDENGNPSLVILHKEGEEVTDTNGQLVYEHKKGDVRYSVDGTPLIDANRDKIYYTDLMFIDAKVYASERPVDIEFAQNLPVKLENYFNIVRNLQDNLLERTHIYFRCVRSTGSALFNMGDGVISKQNLEMSFRIQCYVPSYVKKSQSIQDEIRQKTCQAIEEAIKTKTISMLDIFATVKGKMADYVDHFTLLGINGAESNQTFTIMNEDAQPSIRHALELTEDNLLLLKKQVSMDFIALEDNAAEIASYDA